LHLLVSDITPDGLLIRRTKFQRTRLVPLHETAVTGVSEYVGRDLFAVQRRTFY
jgi:hypothetical protein